MDSVKLNTYGPADYYSQVRGLDRNTGNGKNSSVGSASSPTGFAGAFEDTLSLSSGRSKVESAGTYQGPGPRPFDVASYARSVDEMTRNLVSAYDSDGDGGLSSSEVEDLGMSSTDFSSVDADGDGVLNTDELNNAKAGMDIVNMTNDLVAGKDRDGDGLLSSDEMGVQSDDFNGIDTDSDGKLTRDELNTTAYSLFTKTLSDLQSASSAIASASAGATGSSSNGVNITA